MLEWAHLGRILLNHQGMNRTVKKTHRMEDLSDELRHIEMAKTNAVRLLEGLGIKYELREYDVDPDDLSAEKVASKIGLPPEQLFKTLVAMGDRHGICMAVIPADMELDLKALAAASGNRKIHLAPVKDLQKLTGYIRGGVTALAAKKSYPVYADNSIERFHHISISAGIRGLQILLTPADYLKITKATLAAIAQGRPQSGISNSML